MKLMKRFGLARISAAVITIVGIATALEANAYERISNRENRVRVDVVPVQLEFGKTAKFEIRMNAHSGDLSQDLVSVSTLKDDNGREYRPMDWQGAPPGGHHRTGVLEFPALNGNTKSVTLVIKDVASVPERIYKWNLK
ncbi:MAG: hypothetical protein H8E81_08020 [Deltaproteobacteria bacterium]|nr:hypothetical protein [Deltaproteobacteria bacterium]